MFWVTLIRLGHRTHMAIDEPKSGSTTGYTNLWNFGSNNEMNLRATETTKQQGQGKKHFIGDASVGLPFFWPNL